MSSNKTSLEIGGLPAELFLNRRVLLQQKAFRSAASTVKQIRKDFIMVQPNGHKGWVEAAPDEIKPWWSQNPDLKKKFDELSAGQNSRRPDKELITGDDPDGFLSHFPLPQHRTSRPYDTAEIQKPESTPVEDSDNGAGDQQEETQGIVSQPESKEDPESVIQDDEILYDVFVPHGADPDWIEFYKAYRDESNRFEKTRLEYERLRNELDTLRLKKKEALELLLLTGVKLFESGKSAYVVPAPAPASLSSPMPASLEYGQPERYSKMYVERMGKALSEICGQLLQPGAGSHTVTWKKLLAAAGIKKKYARATAVPLIREGLDLAGMTDQIRFNVHNTRKPGTGGTAPILITFELAK